MAIGTELLASGDGGMADMKGMHGMHGMKDMGRSQAPSATAHQAAPAPSSHDMAGMHMGARPVIDMHTVLADWQVSAFPVAATGVLIALAVWYYVSVVRLQRRDRRWPMWRTSSFLLGLVAIEVALCSSVASLSMFTFPSHVIQHLLLMIIAPPLAALGLPMTLLLQTSSRRTKSIALRGLHSFPFAVLRHPVSVFFLYYLSMYAFFLTPLLGYAMARMWLMDIINIIFLLGATLFWWPMVGGDPIPGGPMHPGLKIVNLLVGVPIESFLGIAILMDPRPVAAIYTVSSSHTGGALLWAASEVATLMALGPVFVEWSKSDERAARRIDARIASGTLERPNFEGKRLVANLRSIRRDG